MKHKGEFHTLVLRINTYSRLIPHRPVAAVCLPPATGNPSSTPLPWMQWRTSLMELPFSLVVSKFAHLFLFRCVCAVYIQTWSINLHVCAETVFLHTFFWQMQSRLCYVVPAEFLHTYSSSKTNGSLELVWFSLHSMIKKAEFFPPLNQTINPSPQGLGCVAFQRI